MHSFGGSGPVAMVDKIISGGQTGVDQAALDVAIHLGYEHGGWVPAGRKTEAGPLSERYQLREMDSDSYPERTRKNVVEADATLIISHGELTGGSALTAKIARQCSRALLHVDLDSMDPATAAHTVRNWLGQNRPKVLNVAGPRATSDRTIYGDAHSLLMSVFRAGGDG